MGQEGQRGFSAFVSYSHADKVAAQKLHRRLEGYRLPKHVAEQLAATTSSDDPAKLGQIFRDREDLPAAQDLSESVKAALQVSAALIVLCSPAAKASKWVAREIETFRLLHPDRPILAALLEGEPEEAFPEPLLQGREPLAADLRKEGDGPRLGFLKVVAGIAGVPLDALVQRDAQRRMRRVMAITGGAVTAMLAMAIMTFVAIQSRNEAQRQRAEAEGLVEYMLTDLRDELKGVGRLDVMTDVNERAMDYYEGQGDLSDMPAESLERRARILHAMGEDETIRKGGDLNKALEMFTEARRVTEALMKLDLNNPDRVFGHAQSEYWVGYIHYSQKDWEKTDAHWQQYKKLADKLNGAGQKRAKWMQEAGYAEGNLCTLELQRKDKKTDPIPTCRGALKKMEHVAKLFPMTSNIAADVANRHGWLADALIQSGELSNGLQHRKAQEKILSNLARSAPHNLEIQDKWVRAQMSLAEDFCRARQSEMAAMFATTAYNKSQNLVEKDSKNRKWHGWNTRIERTLSKTREGDCK